VAKRTRTRTAPPPATAGVADEAPCPCGSGDTFAACCGRYLRGGANPPTAEALMRSRYTAFVVLDEAYVLHSWSARTRPPTARFDPELAWTGLTILDAVGGGLFADQGSVEFRALYTRLRAPGVLHEISSFVREDGRWVYVEGTVIDAS
jgi:SEC-C motif-containing protein